MGQCWGSLQLCLCVQYGGNQHWQVLRCLLSYSVWSQYVSSRYVWIHFFRYSYSSGMHVTILIMFAWVMALVISLPMHITYPGFSSWYSSYACSPMDDLDSAGYRIFSAILEFIVPAILVIVLNFAIVVKIRIRSQLKISRIQQMVLFIFFVTLNPSILI